MVYFRRKVVHYLIHMKVLHKITFILLLIGGLNWLFIGASELFYGQSFDFVTWLFGSWPLVVNLIYFCVGLSAVYQALSHPKSCKYCSV